VQELGLKPMSELNKLLQKYVKLGPGKLISKPLDAQDNDILNEVEAEPEALQQVMVDEEQENLNAKAKDYEYLLGMPMWNLTEEKIKELTKQMN
jgi:hypothetical protein